MLVWTTVIGQRLDEAENTRSMILSAELLKRGHSVVLWTSAYDHIRKEWRKEWRNSRSGSYRRDDGLQIRFMRGCGYTRNVSLRRLLDHRLAARDFLRQAPLLPQPDAIVASLPDHVTAAAAVEYGKSRRIATIVDIRDKWPDIFSDHVNNHFLASLVKVALVRESARATRALRNADAIVAMMQSMMDWGLAKADRTPTGWERVFYLTTSPKNFDIGHPELPIDSKVRDAVEAARGKVTFTFVGTFNRTQHPLLILDALDQMKLRGEVDSSCFSVIIGGDGIDAQQVRQRASKHENVYCTGWLNATEMAVLLSRSHVGLLVMNFSSPAFNNKSFAYLASGLPIINGASGDLAEIIDNERAGINVRAGDVEALGNAMQTLARDDRLRTEMTANVRRLFTQRFDRESNYRAYADHIEQVVKKVHQR